MLPRSGKLRAGRGELALRGQRAERPDVKQQRERDAEGVDQAERVVRDRVRGQRAREQAERRAAVEHARGDGDDEIRCSDDVPDPGHAAQ